MRSKLGVLALAVLASMMIFSQGCASIMEGGKGTVKITSQPQGASYVVYNKKGEAVDSGATPATVTLKRGAGYFSAQKYTVKFTKTGYRDCEARIENGLSMWYAAGNIIFGGLIGWLIVDPLTGAMWTLKDLQVDMETGPRAEATETTENSLKILTIDQVPTELRPRLVRIN